MKKILFVLVILFPVIGKAQFVNIPDPVLVQSLLNRGYGSCMSGNSIDSTCSLVGNTTYLAFFSEAIADFTGIEAFVNLRNLKTISSAPGVVFTNFPFSLDSFSCISSAITSLPALPPNLIYLSVANNRLTSLPSLPNSLKDLSCAGNLITSIPALPTALINFSCNMNQLTSLPALPTGIQTINANGNLLSTIPVLPSSLLSLLCSGNQLTILPVLNTNLTTLNCSKNLITSLPSLPTSLQSLNCWLNLITVLPALNNGLLNLLVNGNLLTVLPALPSTLTVLNCANNTITLLPTLPSTLLNLDASYNLLTSLPVLPSGLQYLYCGSNQISVLPVFPSSLEYISAFQNLLTSIPDLPPGLIIFDCSDNFSLSCLPYLFPNMILHFENCPVTCTPNYVYLWVSNPDINTLPLCDANSTCPYYYNFRGTCYVDVNSNCMQDIGEPSIDQLMISLNDSAGNSLQQISARADGLYSFDVQTFGIYQTTIDTTGLPFSIYCPAGGKYTDTLSGSDTLRVQNDFGFQCKSNFDLAAWSILGFRAAVGRPLDITFEAGDVANRYGVSCTNGISGTITFTISGPATYTGTVNGTLPISVNGNVLTYTINDFGTSGYSYFPEFLVDSTATTADQICLTVSIHAVSPEADTLNNTFTICKPVLSSCDPNEKWCYPSGITDTTNHWFYYTIKFQNTGSSEAYNIYLLDTVDANLNVSSFDLLALSHPGYVQILENNVLKFNFSTILLPDSFTNESSSHGYVQYRIKRKENLPLGTQIRNTAYIYFDYNSAVVTNTTVNTLDDGTSVANLENKISLFVYPNPFNQRLLIQTNVINGTYSIINISGVVVMKGKLTGEQTSLNTSNLIDGMYFVRIESDKGIAVKKIIK